MIPEQAGDYTFLHCPWSPSDFTFYTAPASQFLPFLYSSFPILPPTDVLRPRPHHRLPSRCGYGSGIPPSRLSVTSTFTSRDTVGGYEEGKKRKDKKEFPLVTSTFVACYPSDAEIALVGPSDENKGCNN